MPELPDVAVYIDRLNALLAGRVLEQVRIPGVFVLRSVHPPVSAMEGRRLVSARRIGKRIVLALVGDLYVVIHLMIAGRLRWRNDGRKLGGKLVLATFAFEHGVLYLTEAGSTRRATLHVVEGEADLAQFDRGGLDVLDAGLPAVAERLRASNHTLKRALTDPRIFDGIGNACSDEILHRARLSPLALTQKLDDEAVAALYHATRATLTEWTARLAAAAGDGFPETVTAFHPEMAVHGRYNQPCRDCGAPVQRIRYASNETNYCARCQTGGRILADRAFSRLLRDDWPRSIDELD
jgi:formamidopyrimidine-DNA glycosylase